MLLGTAASVIALVLAFVLVGLTRGGTQPATGTGGSAAHQGTLAPATVVNALAHIDPAVFERAAGTRPSGALQPLSGAALRRDTDGKPLVVYAGADYCPFCAAQRWSLVVALARFGTFSGLGTTASAADDVFPDTSTLSFSGSSYHSDYVSLSAVELQDRERRPLDTPTAVQRQVVQTYDVPPYSSTAGAIPFTDIADRYLMSGSAFSPAVLAGMTAQQIADAAHTGQGDAGSAVIAGANELTAAICVATGDQPAAVCATPVIRALETTLRSGG